MKNVQFDHDVERALRAMLDNRNLMITTNI